MIENTTQHRETTKVEQAGILNQAIRRPHSASLRPSAEGRIVNTLIRLKGSGHAESTLKHVSWHLSYLARFCDIDDTEAVKNFIANMKGANSYKDTFVKSYNNYVVLNGLSWQKPKYKSERKLSRIPTKEVIMNVISASSKKYSVIFRLLMETGVMPHELANVSLRDIDLEKGTLSVQGFARAHSSATWTTSSCSENESSSAQLLSFSF